MTSSTLGANRASAVIGWAPVDVGEPARSTWWHHQPVRPEIERSGLERSGKIAATGSGVAMFGGAVAMLLSLSSSAAMWARVSSALVGLLTLGVGFFLFRASRPLVGKGAERSAVDDHRRRTAEERYQQEVERWQGLATDDDARLRKEWEEQARWKEFALELASPGERLADLFGGTLTGAATLVQHWAVREADAGRRVLILDLTRSAPAMELTLGLTVPALPEQSVDAAVWPTHGWSTDPFVDSGSADELIRNLTSTLGKYSGRDMFPAMSVVDLVTATLRRFHLAVTLPNVLRAVEISRMPATEMVEPWPEVERHLREQSRVYGGLWEDITPLLYSMLSVFLPRPAAKLDQHQASMWNSSSDGVTVVALDDRQAEVIRDDLANILAECLASAVSAGERYDLVFVLGADRLSSDTAAHLTNRLTRGSQLVFWMENLTSSYAELSGATANRLVLRLPHATQAGWVSEMIGTSEQFIVNSRSTEWGSSYTFGTNESREYSTSVSTSSGPNWGSRTRGSSEGHSSGVSSSWTTSEGGGEVSNLVERAFVRAETISALGGSSLIAVDASRTVVGLDFHPAIPFRFRTLTLDGQLQEPGSLKAGGTRAV